MGVAMAVQNISTVVSDDEVKKALPALQHQANYQFAPFWHADARLHSPPWTKDPRRACDGRRGNDRIRPGGCRLRQCSRMTPDGGVDMLTGVGDE